MITIEEKQTLKPFSLIYNVTISPPFCKFLFYPTFPITRISSESSTRSPSHPAQFCRRRRRQQQATAISSEQLLDLSTVATPSRWVPTLTSPRSPTRSSPTWVRSTQLFVLQARWKSSIYGAGSIEETRLLLGRRQGEAVKVQDRC